MMAPTRSTAASTKGSLTREPIMFTTNQPLDARGAVLRDEENAEPLLDPVSERGQHINEGSSARRVRTLEPSGRGAPPALG
jgi:hypothetical protein